MSAETLRRAAALMRERAEAATPGPWEAAPGMLTVWHVAEQDSPLVQTEEDGDARYIASMHPGIALAAAEVLDAEAEKIEALRRQLVRDFGEDAADDFMPETPPHVLAFARAYLAEPPQGADA